MTDRRLNIEQLITEKMAGIISPENGAMLDDLIANDTDIRLLWEQMTEGATPQDLKDHFERFGTAKWKPVDEIAGKPKISKIPVKKIAAIAATLLILLVGYLLIVKTGSVKTVAPMVTTSAGEEKKIRLTLSDGRTVALAPGMDTLTADGIKLLDRGHGLVMEVAGEAPATVNLLSVPVGMDYRINLPDGSEIWLNSATQLRFPSRFGNGKREISINGEAYLKVAHDPDRPFVVDLPHSRVQVLGTEFNVNTYDSGTVSVALVKGSVNFEAEKSVILKNGQQAVALLNGSTAVRPFDEQKVTGWTKGFYYFDNASLAQIVKVLPRWFGISVKLDRPDISGKQFTGLVNRNRPVQVFLENLKTTTAVDFYFSADSVLHFR